MIMDPQIILGSISMLIDPWKYPRIYQNVSSSWDICKDLSTCSWIHRYIHASRDASRPAYGAVLGARAPISKISKSTKKDKLKKIIRATNTKKFKPYILLHGYKFFLDYEKK